MKHKEELLTDVKNMLYRRTDDVERLQKVIGDTERQFVDCLQQVKTLGEKDEQLRKELEDLRGAAQELVDMERLREAPKKVLKFLSEAPVACMSNALAYVKSLPNARLEIFCAGDGGGLHRRAIRGVPVRGPTCSRTNCTQCTAGLGYEKQVIILLCKYFTQYLYLLACRS
jgi:hypothetical protein